jgi:hypothetical protein
MDFTELDIFQIEEQCRNYLREIVLCDSTEEEDVGSYVLLSEGVNLMSRSMRQLINGGEEKYEITDFFGGTGEEEAEEGEEGEYDPDMEDGDDEFFSD